MYKDIFRLVLLDEARVFIESLPVGAADKIYWNISRIKHGERNAELFKKLEGTDIWEFRTLFNKISYRLLAFWDRDGETLVIVTHCFIKKTRKTPSKEIEKAERMRKKYFGSINE